MSTMGALASPLATELNAVVESFEVHSPESFSLFDARHSVPVEAGPVARGASAGARSLLADLLYWRLHCRQVPQPFSLMAPRRTSDERAAFAARLAAANPGSGWWDEDWKTVRSVGDEIVVEKNSLRLWPALQEIDAPRMPPLIGDMVRVRFPREFLAMSPGHYVIVGDAHDGRDGPTTRVYWHITDRCAERLVRLLCTALNGAGIGFRLKVLNDPAAFTRADAAILYLPTSSWERSRPIVRATHDDLKSMMRPAVSAFAQEIGHGLGVAEDPEEHVSFGQHRSRLVADCLSVAWGTPDPFATLVDEMSARGFPLERIHLNPGSAGIRS